MITDKILKNQYSQFNIIGMDVKELPFTMFVEKEFNMDQSEWEISCLHILKFDKKYKDIIIYYDSSYGGYIITHNKKVIGYTYNDFYDQNNSIKSIYFNINDIEYYFDGTDNYANLYIHLIED